MKSLVNLINGIICILSILGILLVLSMYVYGDMTLGLTVVLTVLLSIITVYSAKTAAKYE